MSSNQAELEALSVVDAINNLSIDRVGDPIVDMSSNGITLGISIPEEGVYCDQMNSRLSLDRVMLEIAQHARKLLLAVGTIEERDFLKQWYNAGKDSIKRQDEEVDYE